MKPLSMCQEHGLTLLRRFVASQGNPQRLVTITPRDRRLALFADASSKFVDHALVAVRPPIDPCRAACAVLRVNGQMLGKRIQGHEAVFAKHIHLEMTPAR